MTENNVEIAGQKADTIAQFVRAHNLANDGQRLGQRFVNIYISQPWPELFHEQSEKKSLDIILKWLTEHQYYDMMPPLAKTNR